MSSPLRVLRNDSYLNPRRHLLEAQRLLYEADAALQKAEEPAVADLALLAVAHALTAAVAADLTEGDR